MNLKISFHEALFVESKKLYYMDATWKQLQVVHDRSRKVTDQTVGTDERLWADVLSTFQQRLREPNNQLLPISWLFQMVMPLSAAIVVGTG